MKKLTAAFMLLAGLMVSTAKVWAVSDTLLIRVTPIGTKSVSITDTEYNFGNQNLGSVVLSTNAVAVSNNGSIVEGYQLRLNNSSGWTTAAAAGADAFNLRAIFNAADPAGVGFAANDDLTAAYVNATGVGAIYSGDQDASVVNPSASRNLWLRLAMPTSSTVTTEQSFTLEIDGF